MAPCKLIAGSGGTKLAVREPHDLRLPVWAHVHVLGRLIVKILGSAVTEPVETRRKRLSSAALAEAFVLDEASSAVRGGRTGASSGPGFRPAMLSAETRAWGA